MRGREYEYERGIVGRLYVCICVLRVACVLNSFFYFITENVDNRYYS